MKHADLRRIGLIVPAGNMALEWEFGRHLPPGFASNAARAVRPGGTDLSLAALGEMGAQVLPAARSLIRTRPEVILWGCTSGSFVGGHGHEDDHARAITAETGIPALTTARAVIQALAALNARRVLLITPYPDAVNEVEIGFLNHYGIAVTGLDSFRCDAARPIGSLDSDEVAAMVLANRETARASDAVFISCTNLLTLDIIPGLEAELGVPVVSSNLCSLWGALRLANVTGWQGAGWRLSAATAA